MGCEQPVLVLSATLASALLPAGAGFAGRFVVRSRRCRSDWQSDLQPAAVGLHAQLQDCDRGKVALNRQARQVRAENQKNLARLAALAVRLTTLTHIPHLQGATTGLGGGTTRL
jgi:hypothetical protein